MDRVQTADRVTFVYISTCRTSGYVWYRRRVVSLSCTFQRAVLAALRGTDGGSGHFRVHFNAQYKQLCVVQTAGPITFTVRYQRLFAVQAFAYVFSFIKRCLFNDLCQTRVDRRYDKRNVKW